MRDLTGMSVLVTGASSGVGFAAAEAFARAGCDVAVSARGVDGLNKAAKRVRAHGRRALVVPADVTDRDAVQAAVDRTVEEFGSLDILCLNSAITVFGPFETVEADDFDRVVDVTLGGTVNVVRSALPALERSAGTVVVTGSLMSKIPLPTFSSYAAAKHGERGFFNSLRAELIAKRSPVQISMVHPGAINTPVWDHTPSATGHLPRKPPEAYTPQTIATALVAMAREPRPEITVGAEAKALEYLFDYARGFSDLVFAAMYHYFMSGKRPKESDLNSLWDALGKGTQGTVPLPRPSLTLPIRVAALPLRALLR
jgi:NAD(P)-dependent dehydrogenase (short-subunit alcohol dehydrogenase family)